MLNILTSLRKWTASALSLAPPMPLRSEASDTASLPCLSGGTDQINPPFQESTPDTKHMIVWHLEQHPGSSRGAVMAALGIDALTASRELRSLCRGGVLTMSGNKRGARYSVAATLPPAA